MNTELITKIKKAEEEIKSLYNSVDICKRYSVVPQVNAIESEMSEIKIYSPTGICNGSGSDRYKSVTYLSKIERMAARVGCIVYVDSNTDYLGIKHKRVEYNNGYYNHRQLPENINVEDLPTL